MSSSTPDALTSDASIPDASSLDATRAAVLTVSDSCSRGEKVDLSGPAVAETLGRRNFQVVQRSGR
jgi:molybdopterin adenylyltransferase